MTGPEPTWPAVSLVALTKRFGPRRGVENLHLQVERGQVFAFLGPNGAGKSTTIRLMMGLYLPTSGRAELLGSPVLSGTWAVRRRVGYLPGELALPSRLTGRELLDRLARARGGVDPERRTGLEELLGAELDRPLHTLSKGNRQKVGLVQAFMHDPDLLVLDEPTSGLDPLLQQHFETLLHESVDRGGTVFLSSHDLDEVQRLAHRIAIIREGRLVAVDTVQALRDRSPRTVDLTFRRPVDQAAVAALTRAPGARLTRVDGPQVSLTVTGEAGPLLAAAVPLDVIDIVARAADLDELFRAYYIDGQEARA